MPNTKRALSFPARERWPRRVCIWACVALLLALAGCGAERPASPGAGQDENLDIRFLTEPAQLNINGTSTLEVRLRRQGLPLSSAEVVLEIWPKGAGPDSHVQMTAKPEGEGRYTVLGEFAKKGIYYLVTHVTPADTGVMTMASFEFEVLGGDA